MTTIQPTQDVIYRERLAPPLWLIIVVLLGAPMLGLAFRPLGTTASMAIAVLSAIALLVAITLSAPVIKITETTLFAGRAQISTSYIDSAQTLEGASEVDKRQLHSQPQTWLLLRGGIKTAVKFYINDPEDPKKLWIVSSRTPERIVTAVAQIKRSKA